MLFFFKQKTVYEMRISDWSSDVCSSDLRWALPLQTPRISEPGIMTGQQVARIIAGHGYAPFGRAGLPPLMPTGRDGQPKHRQRKRRERQPALHVAFNLTTSRRHVSTSAISSSPAPISPAPVIASEAKISK